MLVLKLRRVGKRHQPFYRLVVSEKRSKSDGKYLENLGWYNPHNKEKELNAERVAHWLSCGAQKTATVHNILISAGIIRGKKIPVHKITHEPVIQEKKNGEGEQKVEENKEKNIPMEEMNPMIPAEENVVDQPASPEMPAEKAVVEEDAQEEKVASDTPVSVPEEPRADEEKSVPETQNEAQ